MKQLCCEVNTSWVAAEKEKNGHASKYFGFIKEKLLLVYPDVKSFM